VEWSAPLRSTGQATRERKREGLGFVVPGIPGQTCLAHTALDLSRMRTTCGCTAGSCTQEKGRKYNNPVLGNNVVLHIERIHRHRKNKHVGNVRFQRCDKAPIQAESARVSCNHNTIPIESLALAPEPAYAHHWKTKKVHSSWKRQETTTPTHAIGRVT
jgi:hypothetical protein